MNTVATAKPRYLELDALRGFAVMGILLMNVIGFAMPDMAYFSPAIYGGTDTPDTVTWFLSFIFVDGKMRGLFTLLFGASTMLVIESAEAKGQNSAKVHYSRMLWLAIFGLAHFFFFWFGDILFLYAAVGCIIYFMRNMKAEKLILVGLLLYAAGFLLYTAMMGGLLFMQHAASMPDASATIASEFETAMADFYSNNAEQIATYQSGFVEIFLTKLSENSFDPLFSVVQNINETLPFMMIGMGLYKQGFFTGEWQAAQYRKWGIWFTAIGIFMLIPMGMYLIGKNFDLVHILNASFAWTMPARLLMTLGYAALLILLIQKFADSGWMHRVAATGRVAFSNYLGTSVLMTFIFYGWGLGLYGSVGRAELYLFVTSVWALMLFWSKPWLMRFRYGPLEWLWRSLARMELQPMRIAK